MEEFWVIIRYSDRTFWNGVEFVASEDEAVHFATQNQAKTTLNTTIKAGFYGLFDIFTLYKNVEIPSAKTIN